MKNYSFMTIHDYILIKNNENWEIVYSQQKEHICQCSFFKILLSVWTDKVECENLLYLFVQNYRIKIELGLNYFVIYTILIHNYVKNYLVLLIKFLLLILWLMLLKILFLLYICFLLLMKN